MNIAPTIPVIGPIFFRHSVRGIARAAKNGNLQAVRNLAGIATTTSDALARAIALDALGSLSSADAIDAFCSEVLFRQDLALEKCAVTHGYAPTELGLRALFLYITGQEDALSRTDPDAHRPLLARGYAAAPDTIKARALHNASDPRKGRILAHALTGIDPVHNAGTWSYGEWEVVISGLTAERSWDELWLLVISAPPSFAVSALQAMKAAGWRPCSDGGLVYDELLHDLPEIWVFPPPEKLPLYQGNQDSRCLRLAFSRDGTLLAAGNCGRGIAVWQVSPARFLISIPITAGSISFLAFTPDNTCLVAGGDNGTMHGFGIPSGKAFWSYNDKGHRISLAVLSGNGEEIFAGDDHRRIIRIGCRTGKILQVLQGHPFPVTALSPAPDGKTIAVGLSDGTICCRDCATEAEAWTVPGTGDAVRAIIFTEQADQLFVVHEHTHPELRHIKSGELVQAYAGFSGHAVCHAVSLDHRIAAIGSDDYLLRLWNLKDKNPATELPFYNRFATCCAITPDSTLLVSGCNEGTVFFFSIPEGQKIKEYRGHKRPVTACAISPDGTLLATAGEDGTVTFWGIPSGELLRTFRRPTSAVTALALTSSSSGAGIIAGTSDGRARFFSREDGSLIRSIDLYTHSVRALAVSHDGTYLACAGSDSSLRIWDLAKGSLVATCEGLKAAVWCLAFLPEESVCISGGWDGVVRFWDLPSGKPSGTLAGHSSIVTCCCLDPSGHLLITGSNDRTVRIWHLDGEKKSTVIRNAKKEVSACAISPDGTVLATAGPEPVIRLYHLPEGTAAGTILQVPGKLAALAFTDDGLTIAAGYDTGTLAFYSVHEHSLIRALPAHAGAVTGIVAVRGKDCIVTSGSDGMIHIFRLPFMRPLSQATFTTLFDAREQEREAGTGAMAAQLRFLRHLLSIRFQSEIELCPTFRDTGMYDIQIVG